MDGRFLGGLADDWHIQAAADHTSYVSELRHPSPQPRPCARRKSGRHLVPHGDPPCKTRLQIRAVAAQMRLLQQNRRSPAMAARIPRLVLGRADASAKSVCKGCYIIIVIAFPGCDFLKQFLNMPG
jgi:hypothetical protein